MDIPISIISSFAVAILSHFVIAAFYLRRNEKNNIISIINNSALYILEKSEDVNLSIRNRENPINNDGTLKNDSPINYVNIALDYIENTIKNSKLKNKTKLANKVKSFKGGNSPSKVNEMLSNLILEIK